MYEIQFHPADIRKQVKYYFLSRRSFRWALTAMALTGAVLLTGAALSPLGIQALLLSSKLHVLEQQNSLQREILAHRSTSLNRLQNRVDAARTRQQQIALILGATQESVGLGGFPEGLDTQTSVAVARQALEHAQALNTQSTALLTLADELASFAVDNQELTSVVPSICPIPVGSFVLTSPFGDRISPFTNNRDFHAGIDLAAREGTPVIASGKGRVVFSGRFPLSRNVRWWRYGNVVVLNHGDRYLSIYAHLEEISVRRGQRVERGEQLGTVGNTGWSTSPHLHYEIRVIPDDRSEPVPVDPRIYILNYQWKGHEAMLIAGRNAPPPAFDPLPSRLKNLR
jgi:murein DD-endopeptidase MepM/ murein hydrolase activator NlpD